MGLHWLDTIVIVGIALLIFGPKTLQSISHNAGRGMGQARGMKNKILAELPLEDLNKVKTTVSQIPLSPQQAAQRLVTSALAADEGRATSSEERSQELAPE